MCWQYAYVFFVICCWFLNKDERLLQANLETLHKNRLHKVNSQSLCYLQNASTYTSKQMTVEKVLRFICYNYRVSILCVMF